MSTPPAQTPLPRARPPRLVPRGTARDARGRGEPRHHGRHRELGERRGPPAPDRRADQGPRRPQPHPLFFGRLDYLHAPGADKAEGAEGERFYIGRRHVHDAEGDPMVIDWRAPGARSNPASKKLDVGLRRRFGYTSGDLTAYEDEHLSDPSEAAATSKLLQQEIERPRVGPDAGHRGDHPAGAGRDRTVGSRGLRLCAGRPRHREDGRRPAPRRLPPLRPPGAAGPHRHPGHRAEQVLPATTSSRCCPRWASSRSSRRRSTTSSRMWRYAGTDDATAAVVKGDARMAEVLRRAVRSHVTLPTEGVVVVRGSRRWRVRRQTRDDRRGVAGPRHPVRRRPRGPSAADRARRAGPDGTLGRGTGRPGAGRRGPQHRGEGGRQGDLAAGRPRQAGPSSAHRRRLPGRPRGRHPRRGRTEGDPLVEAGAVGEVGQVVARRRRADRRGHRSRPAHPLLGHVVLDEAQDLSPMQYRAVGRRCTTGSATVLGDLAQGASPGRRESGTRRSRTSARGKR